MALTFKLELCRRTCFGMDQPRSWQGWEGWNCQVSIEICLKQDNRTRDYQCTFLCFFLEHRKWSISFLMGQPIFITLKYCQGCITCIGEKLENITEATLLRNKRKHHRLLPSRSRSRNRLLPVLNSSQSPLSVEILWTSFYLSQMVS